ncbi:hypothetical protein LSH36_622g00046, partial [Paralvinella palmiformis]
AAHETFLGELNLTDWFFSVDNGASYQGDLVEVIKTDVTTVNVIFQSGFGITIHFLTEFGGVLDLLLMVPPRYNNNTVGLLGVMNNNPSDDLTTPDGRIIPISSVDKQIFNDFGQEWHVATVNDSIFFDKLHFSRRISFVPVFKSEIKMPDDVKIACHGDESCIYDSLVTGAYIKFVDNF